MARILQTYECPHCSAPLTAVKRPDKCPGCGYDFGEAINEYKYPVTLFEQSERLLRPHAHLDAVIAMPVEKALSVLNDALHILETLSAKNVPLLDIRELVQRGIRIGNIATKYDEYIQAGGKHVPSLFIKEGDKDVVQKTASGEGPTGRVTPIL
jgi:hypothetical protein